jgi:hypothetical protein
LPRPLGERLAFPLQWIVGWRRGIEQTHVHPECPKRRELAAAGAARNVSFRSRSERATGRARKKTSEAAKS